MASLLAMLYYFVLKDKYTLSCCVQICTNRLGTDFSLDSSGKCCQSESLLLPLTVVHVKEYEHFEEEDILATAKQVLYAHNTKLGSMPQRKETKKRMKNGFCMTFHIGIMVDHLSLGHVRPFQIDYAFSGWLSTSLRNVEIQEYHVPSQRLLSHFGIVKHNFTPLFYTS